MLVEVHEEQGTRWHHNWQMQSNEKWYYCCVFQHQTSVVFVTHHEESPRKIRWIDKLQEHKAWFEVIGLRV